MTLFATLLAFLFRTRVGSLPLALGRRASGDETILVAAKRTGEGRWQYG
jgi:hypothetical protein